MGKLTRLVSDMDDSYRTHIKLRLMELLIIALLICGLGAVVLAFPPAARAGELHAENSGGGYIVLSDDKPCPSPVQLMYVAIATDADGNYIPGCWFSRDRWIYVVWMDSFVQRYKEGEFKKGKPPRRAGSPDT